MKKEPETWSDIWWHHRKLGRPCEEAAFRADEWERKKKALERGERNRLIVARDRT